MNLRAESLAEHTLTHTHSHFVLSEFSLPRQGVSRPKMCVCSPVVAEWPNRPVFVLPCVGMNQKPDGGETCTNPQRRRPQLCM